MPRSLYARMVAVLLGLLLFLGAILVAVTFYTTRRYEEEVVQRLNRSLSANLVAQDVLLANGEVNEAALEKVFKTLMVVNPSIEVYLLDLDGHVVTQSVTPNRLKRQRVDVTPLKAFLSANSELPILGDDPLSADRRKVFSVSPIMVGDRYEGYLYIVLAGEHYDSVVQRLRGSQILRLSLGVVATALLVAGLAGVILFNLLTRRLRRLAASMERFRESGFTEPVEISSPRRGAGDEIDSLVTTFNDMSQRIIQQVRALKETDGLRRELVANVSHDLRTPLASLKGYIETLQLKEVELSETEREEYLGIASRQSERLTKLVEELFELARLESHDMKPELEPFPLSELIQDIVQGFQLEAERKHITLEMERPDEVPLVSADIGLIQRVLQNLIGNALKHTEEGGSVVIDVQPGKSTVEVHIRDTGCGIPEEELVQVFERFYQASGTPDAPRRTGGLGLAIVKRILELHGSVVKAASTVGEGTVVSFSLPAAD